MPLNYLDPSGLTKFWDLIKPMINRCPHAVGEVIQLVNSSDPNTLWPGTTWTKMEGVFLMGSDSSHAVGSTGGAATHTLTTTEMPSHSHAMGAHTHSFTQPKTPDHSHSYDHSNSSTGGTAISWDQMPSHSHSITSNKKTPPSGSGGTQGYPVEAYYSDSKDQLWSISSAGSNYSHSHTVGTYSTSTGGSGQLTCTGGAVGAMNNSPSTGNSGSGTAFSTLPPYEVVNIWKRTA